MIFFYFLFTNLLWSIFFLSFHVYFIYFFACYKYRKCSSFLSWVKMFLPDLIHYFFRYFYYTLLSYLLLFSLINRMINKLLSKALIKSREYIPQVFSWWNIAFIIINEITWKVINISLSFWIHLIYCQLFIFMEPILVWYLAVPTQTSPHLPPWRGGRFVLNHPPCTSPHLPSQKNNIKNRKIFKIKLCYLQYAIVGYSYFFIHFNIFSWIYDFCYHYIQPKLNMPDIS